MSQLESGPWVELAWGGTQLSPPSWGSPAPSPPSRSGGIGPLSAGGGGVPPLSTLQPTPPLFLPVRPTQLRGPPCLTPSPGENGRGGLLCPQLLGAQGRAVEPCPQQEGWAMPQQSPPVPGWLSGLGPHSGDASRCPSLTGRGGAEKPKPDPWQVPTAPLLGLGGHSPGPRVPWWVGGSPSEQRTRCQGFRVQGLGPQAPPERVGGGIAGS